MRMTNEEFQAEVFRRSAAYQREHTRRIRIMTRAAAFAGCLLLTVGAGVVVLRNNLRGDSMATVSETAAEGAESRDEMICDNAAEAEYNDNAGEESSEDASENAFAGRKDTVNGQKDDADKAADVNPDLSIDGETGVQQVHAEDSFADPKNAVFVRRTEAEVLARYGLDAMPETLHGIPLMKMYNLADHEDQKPGFIVSESDPELILSDENTFLYKSREDALQELTVKLYTANSDDTPVSYAVTSDPEAEEQEEIALFTFRGLGVQMRAYNMDHETLECIVEDMTEYLEEHKHSG